MKRDFMLAFTVLVAAFFLLAAIAGSQADASVTETPTSTTAPTITPTLTVTPAPTSTNNLAVLFTADNQVLGWIQVQPIAGGTTEMDIVAQSQRPERPGAVVIEAYGDGAPTGIHSQSSISGTTNGGWIALFVDGSTIAYVMPEGLRIRADRNLAFGDAEHYLFRCGDDLCWHADGETVNLTGVGK